MATGQTSPAESTFKNQIYFTKVQDQGKCEVLLTNFVFFHSILAAVENSFEKFCLPRKSLAPINLFFEPKMLN